MGNIVQLTDPVSFGNAAVSADGLYEYDSLYQLLKAEGREHQGQQSSHADPVRLRVDHPNDMQSLLRYREEYRYDEVGNILEMKHRRPPSGPNGWTRVYQYATDSNRLLATSAPVTGSQPGSQTALYTHDAAGNMVTANSEASRSPNPIHRDHLFQASRSLIPKHRDHPFRASRSPETP